MAEDSARDDEALQLRQDAKLYPLGQALRATWDADNHASLSKDVTGLMLHLSRVPFEPHEFEHLPPVTPPLPPPAPAAEASRSPGWLARARLALRRSRDPSA